MGQYRRDQFDRSFDVIRYGSGNTIARGFQSN